MTVDNSDSPSVGKASNLLIFRCVVNTLNHVLIGTITIYVTWVIFIGTVSLYTWHVFLSTIGFQTLMAEAIMGLAPDNSWSRLTSRKAKVTLHWVMHVVGSGLAIAGISIEIHSKAVNNRLHFTSIHGQTGLAALVLLCLACCNGLLALFAQTLRKQIKPVVSKLFHNLVGTSAFVIGMVSLMYGHSMFPHSTPQLKDACWWVTLVIMFLSLTGSLTNLYGLIKTLLPSS